MRRKSLFLTIVAFVLLIVPFFLAGSVHANPGTGNAGAAAAQRGLTSTIIVDQVAIGFQIPGLADILTFVIRIFFVIAGLVALVYLLLGAFEWITSGGDEEAVGGARKKITAAIIGVILIVAVLAVIVTLELVVFRRTICFGISCPATIPNLVRACRENLVPPFTAADWDAAVDCDNNPNTGPARP